MAVISAVVVACAGAEVPDAVSPDAVSPSDAIGSHEGAEADSSASDGPGNQRQADAKAQPTLTATPNAQTESVWAGPVVVIDPGHGGDDTGAVANGVVEKESNLEMAFRVETLLEEAGVHVVLTRRDDSRVLDAGGAGFPRNRADRQARVDVANDARADAFVSIHSNGVSDSSVRGVETYHNSSRPFADQNLALATAVHEAVLAESAAAGYPLVDRGVRDDGCLYFNRGICRPLFLLGPARTDGPGGFQATRATQMPGALVELLFITNPEDARLLQTEAVRDAFARGIADGILQFLDGEGLLVLATDED